MKIDAVLEKYDLSTDQVMVWALIPYAADDTYGDSYYDIEVTRKELQLAFDGLGLEWQWQPIKVSNMADIVGSIKTQSKSKFALVLNYCDGIETDGYAGITVIKLLDDFNIAYTGADSVFYNISSSKIEMKQLFLKAGVPTAPFKVIRDPVVDTQSICTQLGGPLIIKPSNSAGSFGLSLSSVVHDDASAQEQCDAIWQSPDGAALELFAEKFISGPEYTVFLVGSDCFPAQRKVYPPLERVINPHLPEAEQFLSYERYWGLEQDGSPIPDGEDFFYNKLVGPDDAAWLQSLAWEAHVAVKGKGYSRVDIRVDASTGQPFVLEVNANCGLSSPEDATSVGYILQQSGGAFTELLTEIFADALQRFFAR